MSLDEMVLVSRVRALARTGAARAYREEAHIGLREMARMLGADAGMLSKWERGVHSPKPGEALAWAEALRRLGAPL